MNLHYARAVEYKQARNIYEQVHYPSRNACMVQVHLWYALNPGLANVVSRQDAMDAINSFCGLKKWERDMVHTHGLDHAGMPRHSLPGLKSVRDPAYSLSVHIK